MVRYSTEFNNSPYNIEILIINYTRQKFWLFFPFALKPKVCAFFSIQYYIIPDYYISIVCEWFHNQIETNTIGIQTLCVRWIYFFCFNHITENQYFFIIWIIFERNKNNKRHRKNWLNRSVWISTYYEQSLICSHNTYLWFSSRLIFSFLENFL